MGPRLGVEQSRARYGVERLRTRSPSSKAFLEEPPRGAGAARPVGRRSIACRAAPPQKDTPRRRSSPPRSPSCACRRTRGGRRSSKAVDRVHPARLRGRDPRAARQVAASARSRASSTCAPASRATTSATAPSPPPARTPASSTGRTTTARSKKGDLLLLDAGVEGHSLYTADITRTLPISGRFSQGAARDLHAGVEGPAAAHRRGEARATTSWSPTAPRCACWRDGLETLGILATRRRGAARTSTSSTSATRSTTSATCWASTCTTAPRPAQETYRYGQLKPGMVLTVEPGLYFQVDDLTVPAKYRGIGVRIEDDVLVTAKGCRNLSADIPSRARRGRSVDDEDLEARALTVRPTATSSTTSTHAARRASGPSPREGLPADLPVVGGQHAHPVVARARATVVLAKVRKPSSLPPESAVENGLPTLTQPFFGSS